MNGIEFILLSHYPVRRTQEHIKLCHQYKDTDRLTPIAWATSTEHTGKLHLKDES